MSPAKVGVGWHGSSADCSEAEEEESIYSEEERGRRGGGCTSNLLMVGEVARGLSLFGGASSEVRRCNRSVVV